MAWFYVPENFYFSPRAFEVGNAALGLWVRAGAWSARYSTNGFIPSNVAYQLGSRGMCQTLVEAGLFEEIPTGYQFHDWAGATFEPPPRHLRLIPGGD